MTRTYTCGRSQSANEMPEFPVHDDIDVQDGETIFKSDEWWKAVVLYEGYRGPEIAVYLWQRREDDWRRQQKYVVRSQEDWHDDKQAIEQFLSEL